MSGTHTRSALDSYRDGVTELLRTGEPFAAVEHAIDDVDDLTTDEKAALWLFAFSLHDRSENSSSPSDSAISDKTLQRELGDALGAAQREQAGAERYRRFQRDARSGRPRAAGRVRPRGVAADGPPLEQRGPSLVNRIARLLNPR